MAENQTEQSGVPDRFLTIKCLGSGATGAVFHAFDSMLQRDVAIKVLHAGFAPSTVARFQREAQAASRLKHPHVVNVLDFGIHQDSRPYLVMEHLNGVDLQSILKKDGSLTPERACRLMIQLCAALQHANEKGVLHRDIKPSNIIIEEREGQEQLKIVDFGLARLVDNDQALTTPGATLGTPFYLSPEVISGKVADARSDIYSCGCVLFECLSGRPPFVGDNVHTTLMMHVNDSPPVLKSKHKQIAIPIALNQIVMKALEKDPADRFQTTNDLTSALDAELSRISIEHSEDSKVPVKPIAESFDYGNALTSSLQRVDTRSVEKKRSSIARTAIIAGGAVGFFASVCTFAIMFDKNESKPGSQERNQFPAQSAQPGTRSKEQKVTSREGTVIDDPDFVENAKNTINGQNSKQTIDGNTPESDLISEFHEFNFEKIDMHDRKMTKELFEAIAEEQVSSITLNNVKGLTDDMLKTLVKNPKLSTLELQHENLNDSSLQIIANCPNLETLGLDGNRNITGSGLKFLGNHKTLLRIYLGETGVTKANLRNFLKHKSKVFRNIQLARLKLNDEDIRSLDLSKLASIDLAYNPISNETVSYLASNYTLRHMNFTNCKLLDDQCLVDLPKTDLQSLTLTRTNVQSLKGISKNHKLRVLLLDGCPIDDNSLLQLKNMRLDKLSLQGTEITDNGLKTLTTLRFADKLLIDLHSCKNVTAKGMGQLRSMGIEVRKEHEHPREVDTILTE